LRLSLLQIGRADDVVAIENAPGAVPVTFMATRSGTPLLTVFDRCAAAVVPEAPGGRRSVSRAFSGLFIQAAS
jgi:hypothetical protein